MLRLRENDVTCEVDVCVSGEVLIHIEKWGLFNMKIRGMKMGKKGLVVDDEKLIVKGLRFSLLQDGYEVDCAYDGEEALSFANLLMILLSVMSWLRL